VSSPFKVEISADDLIKISQSEINETLKQVLLAMPYDWGKPQKSLIESQIGNSSSSDKQKHEIKPTIEKLREPKFNKPDNQKNQLDENSRAKKPNDLDTQKQQQQLQQIKEDIKVEKYINSSFTEYPKQEPPKIQEASINKKYKNPNSDNQKHEQQQIKEDINAQKYKKPNSLENHKPHHKPKPGGSRENNFQQNSKHSENQKYKPHEELNERKYSKPNSLEIQKHQQIPQHDNLRERKYKNPIISEKQKYEQQQGHKGSKEKNYELPKPVENQKYKPQQINEENNLTIGGSTSHNKFTMNVNMQILWKSTNISRFPIVMNSWKENMRIQLFLKNKSMINSPIMMN